MERRELVGSESACWLAAPPFLPPCVRGMPLPCRAPTSTPRRDVTDAAGRRGGRVETRAGCFPGVGRRGPNIALVTQLATHAPQHRRPVITVGR